MEKYKTYKRINTYWICIYTTFKRIELESPGCSGFDNLKAHVIQT